MLGTGEAGLNECSTDNTEFVQINNDQCDSKNSRKFSIYNLSRFTTSNRRRFGKTVKLYQD